MVCTCPVTQGETLCEKLSATSMCQRYLEVAPDLLEQDTFRRMKSEAEWVDRSDKRDRSPGNHECCKDRA